MLKLAVILVLVSSSLGRVYPRMPHSNGRIVGGKDAADGELPYQLSLQFEGSHMCGASILSEDWAVTAAHCVHRVETGRLRLMSGSVKMGQGTFHNVSYLAFHPKYDPSTTDWDIAVLKVSKPFITSATVSSIALPTKGDELVAGTPAVVSGWGDMDEGGLNPEILQKVTIPIYDSDDCSLVYLTYGGITDRMLCAGEKEGGKDSCQGDSGGPLVVGQKLYGIVSWGRGCARKGYPGVYSKVSSMRDFITEETGL